MVSMPQAQSSKQKWTKCTGTKTVENYGYQPSRANARLDKLSPYCCKPLLLKILPSLSRADIWASCLNRGWCKNSGVDARMDGSVDGDMNHLDTIHVNGRPSGRWIKTVQNPKIPPAAQRLKLDSQ